MKLTEYAKGCCKEPFRIFFPIGLLIGMAGVLLWPLLYLGVATLLFVPVVFGLLHRQTVVAPRGEPKENVPPAGLEDAIPAT